MPNAPNAPNKGIVETYVADVLSGKKIACKEIKQACRRYKKDLKNKDYEFKIFDAEFIIGIIETMFTHEQGQKLDGTPLLGLPFLLEPWQKFIIYNLVGFYKKGTNERRFKEALIMIPRKNGKTPFISAFAFAYALLEKASGSKAYIVASNLRDAMQSFNFLKHNVLSWKNGGWRILDNNQSHSIAKKFKTGAISFEALVARDSIVGNICILDELHEYKDSATYDRMKKAQKAYTNKLTIGITTAGHKINSFCFDHMRYCQKILRNKIKDEQMFVFITKADEEQGGYVDYTDPKIHEMANPNYEVTIRPSDIKEAAFQAQEKPISRKEFLAKELNVYTSSIKSYFDIKEFVNSDTKYDWGYENPIEINGVTRANLQELAQLPIAWFGGADLSKMFDLTASALYGEYEGVGIMITHCWYPRTRAEAMSRESGIPYFGWEEEGWLDFVNGDVIEYDEVAKWFIEMRKLGFDIKEIGYDRQMAREFISIMESHNFKMEDVPQKYWVKSEGFRRIELKVKKKQYYYLHSEAYEYCVENVKAVEDASDRVKYEKTDDDMKIDLFDAGVFAVIRNIENMDESKLDDWKW